jgi:hypothetical protein
MAYIVFMFLPAAQHVKVVLLAAGLDHVHAQGRMASYDGQILGKIKPKHSLRT